MIPIKGSTSTIKWVLPIIALLLLVFAIKLWPQRSNDANIPHTVDFNYHIRPILTQNCFVCHGHDSGTREGGLRLDNFESATAQLESGGAAIVPENINKSLLIDRITSQDPDHRMPPLEAKKILSKREIALLKTWIKQGAKWRPHWAFIPPANPNLPRYLRNASPSKVIDYLLEKEWETQKLVPSGLAEKNSLIRRVSYLLTGLPPSPDGVRKFLSDSSEHAYEKIIDQYLSSPHFGERWARHWMDLVRYGESMGNQFDFNISSAWQYRDYLIRAFNQDVPYDLLVKKHLAGDMLENPRFHPTEEYNESMIGTGYFFLGEGKKSPVEIKLEEANKIDNMIDVTSKTFLALTVGCARCHDHKFDPISTEDYYGMYGMIESARLGPLPARKTKNQEYQTQTLRDIKRKIRSELGQELSNHLASQIYKASNVPRTRYVHTRKEKSPDKNEEDYIILGDFRQGEWKNWYADGLAFGDAPLMGEPTIDRRTGQLTDLRSGIASSRFYSSGVQGVLRSPNFEIEKDYIAIKARGINGSIRVIIDNFQVIQAPLWQDLEKNVDDPKWKDYVLNVSLAKGHKAYLQFLPGVYGVPDWHLYSIQPQDYIEVQYAVAYDRKIPQLPMPVFNNLNDSSPEFSKKAIKDWINHQVGKDQLQLVSNFLIQNDPTISRDKIKKLSIIYDSIAVQLYDSTHFIGMTEGDAVFSSVFVRGSVHNLTKKKVPRQFLSAIQTGRDSFPQQGSGRLAWAEAVVDPENPLTSRVIVNRIWHHIFGRGIVETVDNFGLQGKLPTHPELLDYLSIRMIEENWSIKQMIKHILMSEAFRRSIVVVHANLAIDPQNIYLHHFPVRRLEAEAIRDGILAVSGSLDPTLYGKPVPVHLTEFMTGRGRPASSGPLDGMNRRSIYTAVRRNFISPMMQVFDMPIPFTTFGRRNTTNVPGQSLTLMNDPFVKEQAVQWATLLSKNEKQSVENRIDEIYQIAFSRKARIEEIEKSITFLETQAGIFGSSLQKMKDDPRLWASLCHSIFYLKEFIHLT